MALSHLNMIHKYLVEFDEVFIQFDYGATMKSNDGEERRKLISQAVEENNFLAATGIFIEYHEVFDFDFQLTKYEAEEWIVPLMLIGIIIDQSEELTDRFLRVWEKLSGGDLASVVALTERLGLKVYKDNDAKILIFKKQRKRYLEVFCCEGKTQEELFKSLARIYIEDRALRKQAQN